MDGDPDSEYLVGFTYSTLIWKILVRSYELKNFRPISNLSFISKIIEKLVLVQISRHLSANSLLSRFQSAYRPGHYTETALLNIVNDLLLSLDDGNISLLASLDLSAAFDTIDHNILLHRLQHDFDLSVTVLDWFSSYLSGQIQSVSVHSHTFVPASVSCGVLHVPQGSVLGPIIFFLYTTPSLSLLSLNVIRSSIIHTLTTHNSRTLLLRIAFLTSLTLCGFASAT